MPFERILSVTQLNEYVHALFDMDPLLRYAQVRGEISGFKRYPSGHCYFSIKDAGSVLRCVLFRGHAQGLTFQPRDGMRVVLSGSVALYVRDGAYQFYVETMRTDGVGDLYLRFEELKARLEAEGLFRPERKRPLPRYPRRIGIVTSQQGAVLRDIVRIARRRDPGVRLLLSAASVQGEAAAGEIVRALEALAKAPEIDVIIVGRGGGSLEDLWCFNEESVARAIANCPVPVVSAVGHETDFSIADFVADVRASTPSHAAELIVPVREELRRQLDTGALRLEQAMWNALAQDRTRLERARGLLRLLHPLALIEANRQRVRVARERMQARMRGSLTQYRLRMESQRGKLQSLGPQAVLRRGYALVEKAEHIVRRVQDVETGDALRLRMQDGALAVQVKGRELHGGEEARL